MRRLIVRWIMSKVTLEDLLWLIKKLMKRNEIGELNIVDLDSKGRKVMSGRIYCRLDKES